MRKIIKWFSGKNAGRAFLSPTVIILLSLTLFPFVFALYLTFGNVSLMGGISISFAGVKNWTRLFSDERFWNALINTLVIVSVAVFVEYIIGLGLSLMLDKNVKGKNFFRVLFLVPMMLTPIAVGYIWRMMFNQTRGPIDHILTLMGLPAVEWLTSSNLAIFSIIIADIWQWTPFMVLILFAGLQTVPEDLVEAAKIDGGTAWQIFCFVTFPLLIPSSIAAILIRALTAFVYIDKIYILTAGGPGLSTETLTLFAYNLGLRSFDLAYGSTIATSLFVLVLVLSLLFLLFTKKYQDITLE